MDWLLFRDELYRLIEELTVHQLHPVIAYIHFTEGFPEGDKRITEQQWRGLMEFFGIEERDLLGAYQMYRYNGATVEDVTAWLKKPRIEAYTSLSVQPDPDGAWRAMMAGDRDTLIAGHSRKEALSNLLSHAAERNLPLTLDGYVVFDLKPQ